MSGSVLLDTHTRRIDELPENDIWIAAIARQHGLTVISRDQHFNEIENLPVETW